MTTTKKQNILVTGGGGFLGKSICKELLARGFQVTSFSRKNYPQLKEMGITCFQGDLSNYDDIYSALHSVDAIIHTASLAGVWGDYDDYFRTNVLGTQNIIRAAKDHNIEKLVYTSSPSVVHAGKNLCGVDESTPYAKSFLTPYPYTKAIAEKMVLEASCKSFFTTALRPHLIWGPGDPHFLPRLKEKVRAKKIKRLGSLDNLVDIIYIDNAGKAHVDALCHLEKGSKLCGKSYFIGQEHPVNLWDFINDMLKACKEPTIKGRVPSFIAYLAAFVCEKIYRLFAIKKEPPLTRFMVEQLTTSHYFSHQAAQQDFNYKPEVSTVEGLEKIASSYHLS